MCNYGLVIFQSSKQAVRECSLQWCFWMTALYSTSSYTIVYHLHHCVWLLCNLVCRHKTQSFHGKASWIHDVTDHTYVDIFQPTTFNIAVLYIFFLHPHIIHCLLTKVWSQNQVDPIHDLRSFSCTLERIKLDTTLNSLQYLVHYASHNQCCPVLGFDKNLKFGFLLFHFFLRNLQFSSVKPNNSCLASSLMVYRTGDVTSIINGRRGQTHVHQTNSLGTCGCCFPPFSHHCQLQVCF